MTNERANGIIQGRLCGRAIATEVDLYMVGLCFPAMLRGTGTVFGEVWDVENIDTLRAYESGLYDEQRVNVEEYGQITAFLWNGTTEDLEPLTGNPAVFKGNNYVSAYSQPAK